MDGSPSSPSEELLNICWDRVTSGSSIKEYIYVTQVFNLIVELQKLTATVSLLTEEESKLLSTMMHNKASLKLYRHELVPFLLRLVHYNDIDGFLRDRGDIRYSDIRRIVSSEKPRRGHFSEFKSYSNENGPELAYNTSTPLVKEQSKRQMLSPPLSPIFNKPRSNPTSADRFLPDKSLPKHAFPGGFSDPPSSGGRGRGRISVDTDLRVRDLERELESVRRYSQSLETQLEKQKRYGTYDPNKERNVLDLISKNADRERKIANLQDVCDKYRDELHIYKTEIDKKDRLLQEVLQGLKAQETYISTLNVKLGLKDEESESRSKLKTFMINLPFIKQYYFYHKYRTDLKDYRMLLVNVTALVLATVMLIQFMRFLLILIIFIFPKFGWQTHGTDNYINETLELRLNPSLFSWWKEIEWLEYSIYIIKDWFDK
ncbi:Piso0_002082 [Millerozyma farinosa CBS 7064]|uniref:Piso0_002082 protein n=1 Tax=Pichia sorbitophila (strain ATCC MYA-4447 / BCRC 22081 / CBS 7064 / NBRC 10061 / NRRL Y-12695) TaxID=559304 RepID=G8YE27_PICSO|nr:Piso0_002082 [Millerozyma farinosa CBS 7064]